MSSDNNKGGDLAVHGETDGDNIYDIRSGQRVDNELEKNSARDSVVGSDNMRAGPSLKSHEGGPSGEVMDMKNSEGDRKKAAQAGTQADVSGISRTSGTFDAGLKIEGGQISASIGASMSKSTEARTGAGAQAPSGTAGVEIRPEDLMERLRAKGVSVENGKAPLDKVSEAIMEILGVNIDDLKARQDKEREQQIEQLARQLALQLRAERGGEMRAGVTAGASVTASPDGTVKVEGNIAGQLIATGAAVAGGVASLTTGSLKAVGAAAGALGRGFGRIGAGGGAGSPARRFEGVAVLPTISEYRVSKVEEAAGNYGRALDKFWKVESMAPLRGEIEERARKTGVSVCDAMQKMKPQGEWADLHGRFVKGVADSPEATQAKVGLDHALKSWVRQYDHASEELLTADLDENPNLRKARNRVDATKDRMEEMAGQTPVFGGETHSHAERLAAAVQAIMERLKEMLMSVRDRIFGGREHGPGA